MERGRVGALALGLGLGLGMALLGGCETEASACHREAVGRFGCCPTCDGECRAKITEACAEAHDVALLPGEPPGGDESTDGTSGGPSPDDEPLDPS